MVPLWQMSATPRSRRRPTTWSGQQRRAVEEIDEAVAVRAEERQVAGAARAARCVSRWPSSVRGLGEARRRSTRSRRRRARASAPAIAGTSWLGAAMNAASGARRQLVDRAEVALRRRGGARRMDAPELALVADHAARRLRGVRPGAADQRDAARRQQPLQVAARSWARSAHAERPCPRELQAPRSGARRGHRRRSRSAAR